MSDQDAALLSDRGVVSITGEDAAKLLQGVITNDMELLESQAALHAGLLSPQGKILFDFFVVRADKGLLIDIPRAHAADFAKRLGLYKLRAKADIKDVSADYAIIARWPGSAPCWSDSVSFTDPRDARLGTREIVPATKAANLASDAKASDYHAHRIALGIPEGGKDYPFGDAYPHEALFDQLAGVSFKKGCYVGQEVVSRMQHRATVKKRVTRVIGDGALPPAGTEIKAGAQIVGTMGSSNGTSGLALLRLDRADEANEPLRAGDVTLHRADA